MPNTTGVFPCYEGSISVGATKETATTISDMESMSVTFDNGVEEWTPYGEEGWKKRLMTSKSVSVSVSGKRCIGDNGNDFVAGMALKNGRDAEGYFALNFPDGTIIAWNNAVYSVTALNMADSTNVGPLNFDAQSNGKPTVTTA